MYQLFLLNIFLRLILFDTEKKLLLYIGIVPEFITIIVTKIITDTGGDIKIDIME